ncbi:unnamed protein product [Brassica napus]|uniref:(rape) hypothetical protein n=1 Tax=Brassica napus TaxID=3708 RepID=A0A816UF16_BRANA|nr:unnamed protein product [Brassica napus]
MAHNSKSTASIAQRVYFDNIFPSLREPLWLSNPPSRVHATLMDLVHKSVNEMVSVNKKWERSKNATLQLVDMECSYLTVDFFRKLSTALRMPSVLLRCGRCGSVQRILLMLRYEIVTGSTLANGGLAMKSEEEKRFVRELLRQRGSAREEEEEKVQEREKCEAGERKAARVRVRQEKEHAVGNRILEWTGCYTKVSESMNVNLIDSMHFTHPDDYYLLEVDCLRVSLTSVVTVKRSCGEIPELFTHISIMAAGTGSTAFFTVICSFASRRVPFCANKFFNTGLGFSLVILLWAVDRLGRLWLLSKQQEKE